MPNLNFRGVYSLIVPFIYNNKQRNNKVREEYSKRRIRRDKKRRKRRDMIYCTLILTPNGSKKAWPPRKTSQNDGYVYYQLKNKNIFPQTAIFQELKYIYIINLHVCITANRLKYKKRRRQRIVREE